VGKENSPGGGGPVGPKPRVWHKTGLVLVGEQELQPWEPPSAERTTLIQLTINSYLRNRQTREFANLGSSKTIH